MMATGRRSMTWLARYTDCNRPLSIPKSRTSMKPICDSARSTASAPIEAGSDELSLGDTSAFEESGSAWVADDQGGLSISWTGKTASALIGVTGLKRAFAAAAVVTARDDLQTIKGVGPFIEEKLNALGITTFRQVANMTPELEDQVNTAIEFFPGRVRRDKWAKQAEEFDK